MKKRIRIIIFLLFLFVAIMPHIVLAQAIPINKMVIEIAPAHKDKDFDIVTPKTVRFNQTKRSLRAFWYTLIKERVEEAYYQTYKVKANKGIFETNGFEEKRALILPAMWGSGYVRSETALPLWLDPAYLELKGKKRLPLNIGMININKYLLRAAPEDLIEKITYLQNLFDQYVQGYKIKEGLKLSRSTEKELNGFIEDFFSVKKLANTKAKIKVNGTKETYPVMLIGNDYFHFTVIEDPLNPLVVSFKLFKEKMPRIFKDAFKDFENIFEFYIAEITY